MSGNPILWRPNQERIEKSAMFRFMTEQGARSYDDFHQWSVDHVDAFWQALCDYCDIDFTKPANAVLEQSADITTASWFAGSMGTWRRIHRPARKAGFAPARRVTAASFPGWPGASRF